MMKQHQTRRPRTVGRARRVTLLALGLLALSALIPVIASAEEVPRWTFSGGFEKSGKSVEWKSSEHPLVLTESWPGLGPTEVRCGSQSGKGVVGLVGKRESRSLGEITGWTFSSCSGNANFKLSGGCESTAAQLTALNLPWKTELTLSGSTIIDTFTEGKGGFPAIKITCKKAGVEGYVDECLHPPGATMTNLESEGPAFGEFREGPFSDCAVGKSGRLAGGGFEPLPVGGGKIGVRG